MLLAIFGLMYRSFKEMSQMPCSESASWSARALPYPVLEVLCDSLRRPPQIHHVKVPEEALASSLEVSRKMRRYPLTLSFSTPFLRRPAARTSRDGFHRLSRSMLGMRSSQSLAHPDTVPESSSSLLQLCVPKLSRLLGAKRCILIRCRVRSQRESSLIGSLAPREQRRSSLLGSSSCMPETFFVCQQSSLRKSVLLEPSMSIRSSSLALRMAAWHSLRRAKLMRILRSSRHGSGQRRISNSRFSGYTELEATDLKLSLLQELGAVCSWNARGLFASSPSVRRLSCGWPTSWAISAESLSCRRLTAKLPTGAWAFSLAMLSSSHLTQLVAAKEESSSRFLKSWCEIDRMIGITFTEAEWRDFGCLLNLSRMRS